jgi:hypothetical protein
MACRQSETGELGARGGDVGVALDVTPGRAAPARLDEPEALELARQLGGDPRPAAQLVQLDLVLALAQRDCPAPRPLRDRG